VKTGSAVVVRRNQRVRVTPVLLADGAERSAVIKATTGQPFPANVLFRAARSHVDATGTSFRLGRLTD